MMKAPIVRDANLDSTIQAQIVQLAEMQRVLSDTLQTQLCLMQTHFYMVNMPGGEMSIASHSLPTPPAPVPAPPPPPPPPPVQQNAATYSLDQRRGSSFAVPHNVLPTFVPPVVHPPPPVIIAPLGAPPTPPGYATYVVPGAAPPSPCTACVDGDHTCTAHAVYTITPTVARPPPHSAENDASAAANAQADAAISPLSEPRASPDGHRSPVKRLRLGPNVTFPSPVLLKRTKEGKYRCEHCGRVYSLQRSLMQHLKIHLDKCPYQCSNCGRRFSRKGHVDAHARTHTQEKPYACRVCSKSFNQKSGLMRHIRAHNHKSSSNMASKPLSAAPMVGVSGD